MCVVEGGGGGGGGGGGEAITNKLREKSLAIYLRIHSLEERTFNFIVSKIYVDKHS